MGKFLELFGLLALLRQTSPNTSEGGHSAIEREEELEDEDALEDEEEELL